MKCHIEIVLPLEPENVTAGRPNIARGRIPRPGVRVGGRGIGEERGRGDGVHRVLTACSRVDAGIIKRLAQHRGINEHRPVAANSVAIEIVSEHHGYGIARGECGDAAQLPSAQHPRQRTGLEF